MIRLLVSLGVLFVLVAVTEAASTKYRDSSYDIVSYGKEDHYKKDSYKKGDHYKEESYKKEDNYNKYSYKKDHDKDDYKHESYENKKYDHKYQDDYKHENYGDDKYVHDYRKDNYEHETYGDKKYDHGYGKKHVTYAKSYKHEPEYYEEYEKPSYEVYDEYDHKPTYRHKRSVYGYGGDSYRSSYSSYEPSYRHKRSTAGMRTTVGIEKLTGFPRAVAEMAVARLEQNGREVVFSKEGREGQACAEVCDPWLGFCVEVCT